MGIHSTGIEKGASGRCEPSSMPRQLWRSRAKSHSREFVSNPRTWTPAGRCRWRASSGHQVTLSDTSLLSLSETERRYLQQVALIQLKEFNLGCRVEIPKGEPVSQQKTRRRPALLKKKSATTSVFEGKETESPSRSRVFGLSLSQCIHNDRLNRQRALHEQPSRPDRSEAEPHAVCSDTVSETSSVGEDRPAGLRTPGSGSAESLSQMKLLEPGASDTASLSGWSCGSTDSMCSSAPLVPNVVNSCFKHIETYGLNTLGIFRISSSKRRVRQLREELDSGKDVKLNEEHNPHDVAQLLKEYFRDLPEPLLTRELYPPLLATLKIRDRTRQKEALRFIMYLLPPHNRDTVWALLSFLSRVADHSGDTRTASGEWLTGNRMDSNNLATLFGPNILRMTQTGKDHEFLVESADRALERSDVILVVRNLIDYHEKLFEVPADILDSVYHRLYAEDPTALEALLQRHFHSESDGGHSPAVEGKLEEASSGQSPLVTKDRSRKRDKRSSKEGIWQRAGPLSMFVSDIKSQLRPLLLEDSDSKPTGSEFLHVPSDVSTVRRKSSPAVDTERHKPLSGGISSGISAAFTVTVPLVAPQATPRVMISEVPEDKAKRNRAYGKQRHLTSPSYRISEVKEEMSITIRVPRRREVKQEPKSGIEKSASTSVMFWRDKSKVKKDQSSTFLEDPPRESASALDSNHRRLQTSATVKFPQERWKRWEIIASEHTQH